MPLTPQHNVYTNSRISSADVLRLFMKEAVLYISKMLVSADTSL